MKRLIILSIISLAFSLGFTVPSYKLAKLKYSGGGDWYANRTALANLIQFCNKNIGTNFDHE